MCDNAGPSMRGRRRRALVLLATGLALGPVHAKETSVGGEPLPPAVRETFQSSSIAARYSIAAHLRPGYLQGDFNGDGKQDTALLVVERGTDKIGIGIFHGASERPIVIGAGRSFGNGGDDFQWMDAWSLYPKQAVAQGADDVSPPSLIGDAILVEKTMAASAVVYWAGDRYMWYQQGD